MASWKNLLSEINALRSAKRDELVTSSKAHPDFEQLFPKGSGNVPSDLQLHQYFDEQAFVAALDALRFKYIQAFASIRGRNVICYYSGWQAKEAKVAGMSVIQDSDRDGFMGAVHELKKKKGLDLFLHTPGGYLAAADTICSYLLEMFDRDIEIFIPHTCMSAGTMIAFCGKKLYMGKQSVIGPVDPQIGGMPASGILRELEEAKASLEADPSNANAAVWRGLLSKYHAGLVSECQRTLDWSKKIAKELLLQGNLSNDAKKDHKADIIVEHFTDYEKTKNHARQIRYEEARRYDLEVCMLEDDQALQDATLAIHHLYAHTFNNTPAYKIISNNIGHEYVQSHS